MKFKRKTTTKILRCRDGEVYRFKNGRAEVPGVKFQGKPVFITLKEFEELQPCKKQSTHQKL